MRIILILAGVAIAAVAIVFVIGLLVTVAVLDRILEEFK